MSIDKWWGYVIGKDPNRSRPTPREGSFNLSDICRFEKKMSRNDGTEFEFYVYLISQPGIPVELDSKSYAKLAFDYAAYLKQLYDDPTDQLRATVLDQQAVINQLTVENQSLKEKLEKLNESPF